MVQLHEQLTFPDYLATHLGAEKSRRMLAQAIPGKLAASWDDLQGQITKLSKTIEGQQAALIESIAALEGAQSSLNHDAEVDPELHVYFDDFLTSGKVVDPLEQFAHLLLEHMGWIEAELLPQLADVMEGDVAAAAAHPTIHAATRDTFRDLYKHFR